MRPTKALLGGLVATALVAAPISSASAHWRHRGVVPDLFGAAAAVVVGAATIATAPIAILAEAGSRGGYGGRSGYDYYGSERGYYGPQQAGYYAPPRRYSYNYGPPPGYYRHRPRYYYGPPPGY
jgi:hypothetical protein